MPLKFGGETVTYVTCARCKVKVQDRNMREAEGWGETPLSVTWVWPSSLGYEERHESLKEFCVKLAEAWACFDSYGHPLEVGNEFNTKQLPNLLQEHNADREEPMPWLAALVCSSLFDICLLYTSDAADE